MSKKAIFIGIAFFYLNPSLAQIKMKSLLRKKPYFFAGTERPAEAPGTASKNRHFDQKLEMESWIGS
ncbi:hypothetical protein [Flavobacterium fluviatile]|uniref:hypothetical protein n=1 Tax=Flavobacterium fluviatile TaxID=1862387 RepID=UPI0013D4528A|nr:hypothetical protein [Flavobacterium fluviatile]